MKEYWSLWVLLTASDAQEEACNPASAGPSDVFAWRVQGLGFGVQGLGFRFRV